MTVIESKVKLTPYVQSIVVDTINRWIRARREVISHLGDDIKEHFLRDLEKEAQWRIHALSLFETGVPAAYTELVDYLESYGCVN